MKGFGDEDEKEQNFALEANFLDMNIEEDDDDEYIALKEKESELLQVVVIIVVCIGDFDEEED
jgi:hypothetical protein